MIKVFLTTILFFLLNSTFVRAEVVQFKEEELPRESVVPIFDQPEAVKKRYVPYDGRFEMGLFFGALLNDPFYNSYPAGLELRYHFHDMHAFGVVGTYNLRQKTPYIDQIRRQVPSTSIVPFESSPTPEFTAWGEYEFTPYYGKISLTKQGVMNLSISLSLGVGYLSLKSDNTSDSSVGYSIGLNQRLFFTRNFGIKLDLKVLNYTQADVVPPGTIEKKALANTMIGLGVVYLLPSL
ncbi:MAG: outer membrane beta-barrel domain-containing protein [Oligoflexia bacterium]|nr:outer membrane beta-barrel domain-containing protein [Oligoflexia bacterium]